MRRGEGILRFGQLVHEQHDPWCGLAYVERHGLPGYPKPRILTPTDQAPEVAADETHDENPRYLGFNS